MAGSSSNFWWGIGIGAVVFLILLSQLYSGSYVKRGINGRLRDATEDIGNAYADIVGSNGRY